jgi:hypothetical protein
LEAISEGRMSWLTKRIRATPEYLDALKRLRKTKRWFACDFICWPDGLWGPRFYRVYRNYRLKRF